jgi:hypothetical protein
MLHLSPQQHVVAVLLFSSLQESGQVEWQHYSFFMFLSPAVRGLFLSKVLCCCAVVLTLQESGQWIGSTSPAFSS